MNAGSNSGARFELNDQGENLLGRDWQCHIALSDPQCSRVHAAILQQRGEWWIYDRGSSNGTFVNGQGVDNARIVQGTEIRIGGSQFLFLEQQPVVLETEETLSEAPTGSTTIVFDESHNTSDFGQYTLRFLKGSNLGQDVFFLFQLSVKLLGIKDPEQVVRISLERLLERTGADVAGLLWLNESAELMPRIVIPEQMADRLVLKKELTKRVVYEKHAIRVEYESGVKGEVFADAICVPLIASDPGLPGTAPPQVDGAIHLYRIGKRFDDTHLELASALANILTRALRHANEHAALAAQHQSLARKTCETDELIGESAPMLELKSRIQRVSRASGCVLVRGESGSGKELVARALHRNSPRADRPMLSVNCAAIPRELMESQLFGHRKGAFTSADRDHTGWFQQADMGTLFLDEIGELTLEGQAKLLRILEGHSFMPVGSSEPITVDVRVICATNRDLQEFVAERRFREDLYYRLSVYELNIPPLRDRGSDIQLLVDRFLAHFRIQHSKPELGLSDAARQALIAYSWPGNVRQLRNVIDSAVVMAEGSRIEVADLGIRGAANGELESLRIEHWERKLIQKALERTDRSVPEAAELLGISRATLYRKIEEYKIQR